MIHQDYPRPEPSSPLPADAKKVFAGVIFDVYQWQQELYDGTFATFERLARRDSVLVVPITQDGTIVITHQEQPNKGKFITFAGGVKEDGESVSEAAARELLEETGYEAESFTLWESFQLHNKIDGVLYVLVAKGCKKVAEQHLDAGERISMKEVTFDELKDIVEDPRFHETNITTAFLRARLHPEKMATLEEIFRP